MQHSQVLDVNNSLSIFIRRVLAGPNSLGGVDVSSLLAILDLEQIAVFAIVEISAQCSFRMGTEIDNPFFPSARNSRSSFAEVNLLNTKIKDFSLTATRCVEKLQECSISELCRSAEKRAYLRLRECWRKADRYSAGMNEARRHGVHNTAHVKEIIERA